MIPDTVIYLHVFTYFFSLFPGNAVLQLHTDVFTCFTTLLLLYGVVCRFVRFLMAFVCQEIKGLLTYLLITLWVKLFLI